MRYLEIALEKAKDAALEWGIVSVSKELIKVYEKIAKDYEK